MENNKGIPVPLNEKEAQLMSALADELKKISINITPGTIMYFAGALAKRVVKEGWQWHPVDFDLDHNRVALPTPEDEKEFIDRIISGLPPTVTRLTLSTDDIYQVEGVKLVDVNSMYPQVVNQWDRIPTWDNYEINITLGLVRNKWTKRTLDFIKDGEDNEDYVEMHDKDGFTHFCHVPYLIEMVQNS